MQTNEKPTTERLFAKVLREVLAIERFDTYADLVEVLKCQLARYRLRWTNDEIGNALRLIGSNRALLAAEVPEPRRIERVDPPPDLPKLDAARRLSELMRGRTNPIKPMPNALLITQSQADKLKALRMVLDEIAAAEARCEALEKAEQ